MPAAPAGTSRLASAADCRFAGAYNLDKMRLEADVSFAVAPTVLGRMGWDWREVIAEERDWRAARSSRWKRSWWPAWPDAGDRPAVLQPGQIAGLYRALRKGREDANDQADAEDLYYGEMDMRRHARQTVGDSTVSPAGAERGQSVRGVLTAYWLVSGYGTRAWRALPAQR